MQQRAISFSSGSRQAPDPYDQFLEHEGFYRKHTARDASSLFRVISEQMYDTQLHHLAIRKKCVNYMRKHQEYFKNLIDRDIHEYLDEMCKPKTFGTLIELQAVGLLYERNILLFEPFNLGNMFGCVHSPSSSSQIFRVFCTPEKHFDCVYTSEFIKDAAICQSLVYELLYKDLFKLPDVQYAVDVMLHNGNVESEQNVEKSESICVYLSCPLDAPENTNCILEDSKLCRFHDSVHEDDSVRETSGTFLLPNKYVSCVRQLLMEGITPFPYKVAKALDPTMYRNIEFDSWSEARKELRLQNWYYGDGNFKVGAKCHVKLGKIDDLYTGHIQDISSDRTHCLVFIEQFGEKRLVPYDALSPLPFEEFKPWTIPYRLNHKYHSRMSRVHCQYNCRYKAQAATVQNYCKNFPAGLTKARHEQYAGATFSMDYGNTKQQHHFHKSYIYNLTHLENFHARTLEYVTMPLTVEHSVDSKFSGEIENGNYVSTAATVRDADDFSGDIVATHDSEIVEGNRDNGFQQAAEYAPEYAETFYSIPSGVAVSDDLYGCEATMQQQFGQQNGLCYVFSPSNVAGGLGPVQPYSTIAEANGYYGQPVPAPNPVYISTGPMSGLTTQYIYAPVNPYYLNPIPTSSMMPPTLLTQASSLSHSIQENANNSSVVIATPLSGRINYEAKKSFKADGMDLPSDIPTLRYFYNLGIDSHNRRRLSNESSVCGREGVVKEERLSEVKDKNNNINKTDDNNNTSSPDSFITNPSNANNKSQYGPPRRYQPRYNNNSRDLRQTQRKNENGNTRIYSNSRSNCHEHSKQKHQNQHCNSADGQADSNQPKSTLNTNNANNGNVMSSRGGRNHRMQYPRNYSRNLYIDNIGNAGVTGADYEFPTDASTGHDRVENVGQVMYFPSSYGPPAHPTPSSFLSQSNQDYENANDLGTSNYNNFPHTYHNGPTSGARTASAGNMLVPVQFQHPNGAPCNSTLGAAPATNSLLQPTSHINTFVNSPSIHSTTPSHHTPYFGYPPPPPQPIMHSVNYGGGLIAAGGFYRPPNQLSSNASESSGHSLHDDCNLMQPPPSAGPIPIPIYVTPGNPTNSNGQSMMHHSSSLPPPTVNAGHQTFLCVPPPPLPTSAMQPSSSLNIPSVATNITNVGAISTEHGKRKQHPQQQNENESTK